eukprot:TRINITY_DN802_c0_g1_i1.p1 TRINITY_DN802_c0_g1~~TRINITY_DN802_c0_g1_i1.p1  ORF type:complete len:542 (+),score=38.66 TRINITY_DN802_c0_g1_i1:88-1626(+)
MQRLVIIGASLLLRIQGLAKTKSTSDIASSTLDGRPHIIFALADDLGWHDVGFQRSQIKTPILDRFAREGRRLDNYYVQPTCSPTRATIMTGRHSTSHGIVFPFDDGVQMGLGQAQNLLAQVLAGAGYRTHAVGKWHLGFCREEFTPTFKGFDSFYGFYGESEDYRSHMRDGAFDFRIDEGRHCGSSCSIVAFNASGYYSTTLFTERAKWVISKHNTEHPLFLYLAWQAVHAPQESMCPYKLVGKYNTSPRESNFACAVALLDQSFGEVVEALSAKGILENSILIFSSDNGGATSTSEQNGDDVGSSNWPLRGGKHTLFEGGVRVVGFVWAGWWNHAVDGVYDGLMGSVDWFPTLLEAASVDVTPETLEGVSHWRALTGSAMPPRQSLFISIAQFGFRERLSYAFRFKNFKLIVGPPCLETHAWGWSGPYGSDLRLNDSIPQIVRGDFNKTLLFNLDEDPAETTDLSDVEPLVLQEMMEMLNPYMIEGLKVYVEESALEQTFPVSLVWAPWV